MWKACIPLREQTANSEFGAMLSPVGLKGSHCGLVSTRGLWGAPHIQSSEVTYRPQSLVRLLINFVVLIRVSLGLNWTELEDLRLLRSAARPG